MSTKTRTDTINGHLFAALARFADHPMQIRRDRTWTYAEATDAIHGVALFLRQNGIGPGDRVAIVAENSPRWFHVYAACLAIGAVAVPRGEDIAVRELHSILLHSECKYAFAGSERAASLLPDTLRVTRTDGDAFPAPVACDADTLAGYGARAAPNDLAVLLYTSGTTGRPKGVMLEQQNIAHNIRYLPTLVDMQPGDVWVSILPSWHTFEQTVELCGFAAGNVFVYSDKRRLKQDLQKHQPQFFAAVPRVWEALYRGVCDAIDKKGGLAPKLFRSACRGTRRWRARNPLGLPPHLLGKALFYRQVAAALGGRLKHGVSGGGYLPRHIDQFFADVGVSLLVGYGLTETAPVVALRVAGDNIVGTIGRAAPETEIRVGDNATFLVRGPQVMRGYYKDEDLTRSVLDDAGWFDTGDLGKVTEQGDLIFVGRAKETIVLSGGENVEPEPIEHCILQVPGVAQVIVVGQDRKNLGALVVPSADADDARLDADDARLIEAYRDDIRAATRELRSFERINRIALLPEPFAVENGLLTPTLKLRRNVIAERYSDLIDSMYS